MRCTLDEGLKSRLDRGERVRIEGLDSRSEVRIVPSPDSSLVLFPGFVDVHTHLREPGFSYKETIASGTEAAAHGGYTTVFTMPNLNPVQDSPEHIALQWALIREKALVEVLPYAAITLNEKGLELAPLEALAPFCAAFSDDGKGVQDQGIMLDAMKRAKKLGKIIAAHCEDESLLRQGYIHDGAYALQHGHRGICSESEWRPIQRDLNLLRQSGCAYHVCHVSAKESIDLIRQAKREGLDVSCETAPHYLLMDDSMLQEDGRFKMNPPLRAPKDREALIEGLLDGTIDMIATDHAPHSAEEKGRGLEKSLMGVVGLESAFALLYKHLVKTGIISLKRLTELMAYAPRKRFGLPPPDGTSFCVFDLSAKSTVDPERFRSLGRATPFTGWEMQGECLLTVYRNEVVWKA